MHKRLRIAMLVYQFPLVSETFVVAHVRKILEAGHDLRVFALGGKAPAGHQARQVLDDGAIMSRVRFAAPQAGSRPARMAQSAKAVAAGIAARGMPMVRLAARRLCRPRSSAIRLFASSPFFDRENHRYDVVHAQFGALGRRAVHLRQCGLIDGPILTHFRGFDISQLVQKEGKDVYKHLFEHGEHFVANCALFRGRAISLGCPADRIDVIGSGTDLDMFAYRPAPWRDSDPVRVLSVGRLVEKKGFRYCVEAVAGQIRSGASLDYEIVGEGEERAALQRLIDDLGVREQVRLIGKREPAEVVELLRGAHLFLAPSLTAASGDTEGPVNTLKEAMATGVPVIATWHGGIPELVEDGVSGLLVAERDSAALGGAIARLIADAGFRASLITAARRRVEEKYDMRKLNEQIIKLYDRVAASYRR